MSELLTCKCCGQPIGFQDWLDQRLTPMEKTVLARSTLNNWTTIEIAATHGVTRKTVNNYHASIRRKLGLNSAVKCAAFYKEYRAFYDHG